MSSPKYARCLNSIIFLTKQTGINLNFHPVRLFSASSVWQAPVLPAKSLISWDATQPVNLRMTNEEPGSREPETLPDMLASSARRHPDRAAMKIKRNGKWIEWSYTEMLSDIRTAAKAFNALGLDKHCGVGILGPNCPEWVMSSAGAVFAGGLSVGIYPTNSPEVTSYISNHAPMNIFVVGDQEELDRVLNGRKMEEAFPTVKKFVLIEGEKKSKSDKVITWDEMMQVGKNVEDDLLNKILNDMAPNEACMLVYTSGTTGPPKGAILSHDNVTWSSYISMTQYKWIDGDEVILSYLPLSHIAPIMIDYYMSVSVASTVCFADKDALKGTLVDNLKEVRPTKFWGVPRVFEKVKEKMMEVGRQNTGIKKSLADWAKAQGLERRQNLRKGITKETLSYKIARKLVFSRIREALGFDRHTRNDPHSGGAPLEKATIEYFDSLDLGLTDFYGMTEATGPICTNMPGANMCKVGTVGKPYWGVGVKLLDVDLETGQGEIAFSGRNAFMGYHKQESVTKETFTDDGWVRTGDIGITDEDGFLTIKGRVKELIVTSGGENIAPVPIEEIIKKELPDIVSNCIVIGDGYHYLTCLLTLKVTADPITQQPTHRLDAGAIAWINSIVGADAKMETISDFSSGPHADKLAKAITEGIDRANEKAVSRPSMVQKFHILPSELSQSGGELGPTLKIKRFFIRDKYQDIIKNMYEK